MAIKFRTRSLKNDKPAELRINKPEVYREEWSKHQNCFQTQASSFLLILTPSQPAGGIKYSFREKNRIDILDFINLYLKRFL